MIAWLYRVLFARRVKWVLRKYDESGDPCYIRYTIRNPSVDDIEETWEIIAAWRERGWELISGPRRKE